jgi:hypothetical protein
MNNERSGIEKMLMQIFDILQEIDDPEEHTRRRQEFVFHMLDWRDDLEKLCEFYTNPDKYGSDTSKIIAGILYHIIPHLNAAGRLLLDTVPDPFREKI